MQLWGPLHLQPASFQVGIDRIELGSEKTDQRHQSLDKAVKGLDTSLVKLKSDVNKKERSIASIARAVQRWMTKGKAIFEQELTEPPASASTSSASTPESAPEGEQAITEAPLDVFNHLEPFENAFT
jgi:hypothetical protein